MIEENLVNAYTITGGMISNSAFESASSDTTPDDRWEVEVKVDVLLKYRAFLSVYPIHKIQNDKNKNKEP